MTVTLNILAEDKSIIAYRPKFAALLDSAMAAILLQQMIYYWKISGGKPFYKFKEPCSHTNYRAEDSWCETLEWSRYEFDSALNVIATKSTKGASKSELLATTLPERKPNESHKDFYQRMATALKRLVVYWTDANRVTWYQVNSDLLDKVITQLYLDKVETLRYLVKLKSSVTCISVSESQDSETTRETAKKRTLSDVPSDSAPPLVILETPSTTIQEIATSQPVEQSLAPTPIQEATPPKPKIDLWEYATLQVWPGGTKYWRNILNMLSGRSKTGQWAEWNFEEEMRPKSPAVILAFKRYMSTEEDENGELKYEKMRFPEKPEAIYKYWGFFQASKRYDRLVKWGEMQLQQLINHEQSEQTRLAEIPTPVQPAPVEGGQKRLTPQEMIEQLRPKMHVNTIMREREAQKKAAGQ